MDIDEGYRRYVEFQRYTAWTDYDPARANRLLDQLGLTERDDRGLRLMDDGEPLEIILQVLNFQYDIICHPHSLYSQIEFFLWNSC